MKSLEAANGSERRDDSTQLTKYRDGKHKGLVDQDTALLHSTTSYSGNLSFYMTEEQIIKLQVGKMLHSKQKMGMEGISRRRLIPNTTNKSKAGDVKRIIIGLDRFMKTPCGFAFVKYYYREDAENAMRYINGTNLDERIIRTDWDAAFKEGRQYGRGRGGGQVRDEFRMDNDMGRRGWGRIIALKQSNGRNQFKPQQQPDPIIIPLGPGAAGNQNGGKEETGPKMES